MKPVRKTLLALAAVTVAFTAPSVHAANGTWTLNNNGNWTTATNWSGSTIADGADFTANFTANITANRTVTLAADRTIGNITFTDSTTSSHNLTISGANILTLDVTTGSPILDATQSGRTLTISSIVAGNDGLTKNGAGAVTLSGLNTYTGTTTITAGTLSINRFTNGGVAGSLGMASNASSNLVMTGGTLSYSGGSTTTDRGMTFGALTGGRIITVSTAATNLNLTNVVAGTDGQQIDVTKGGGGTLTLSNDNNSYIGRTFVSGGTLAVTSISAVGAGNSSIGVATSAANGLISIGTGTTTTTLSYIGTGNSTDRDLNLPGTAGGGVIDQSGTGLLKFTGAVTATGIGSKTLTLGGSTSGTGEIAGVIVDNGTTGTTLATAASSNSTALVLSSLVGLTVGDPITGTGIPGSTTISAINPATRTVTLSQNASVASGATITSAGLVNVTSLTKSGTGTWALSGANTYTGTTTVSDGTLNLGGGTATGSLSSPTLTLAGGTLSYTRTGNTTQGFTTTNVNGTASQISVVSGNTLNLGTVVRGAGGALDFSSTGAGTVAALTASNVNGIMPGLTFGNTWAVANGAGVAISGLGSYTLTSVAGTTGANYLNGNIDVNNSAGLLDAAITGNSLRFSSAATNTLTLAADSNIISAGGILVNSAVGSNLSTITGGTLTGAANQGLAIIQNNTSGGLTISSSIVDNTSTSVTKSGAGLLTLNAANTYTGGTTVSAGTLKLSGAGTLGPAGASVAVNSGALLDLNGTDQSIAFTAGTGVGTVANNSGSGTSTLTLAGPPTINGGLVTIVDNTNSTSGKVAVVITGNTQPMSNLNTYSGGTTVNAGAFLYLNSASPSGAGTGTISLPASGATTSVSSGLLVDGGTTYANDITGAGYVHNNSGAAATATLTGNVNTSGNFNVRIAGAGFNFAGSGNSTLSGVIGPAGVSGVHGPNDTVSTGILIKSGTGTLTLTGANVYTGTTTISGGVLRLGDGGTTGSLSPSSTITNNANLTINRSDAVSQGTHFSTAAINGTGSFTQAGGGNTTLTASNTYSGATTISGGTLALGATGSIANSSTIIVGATTTFNVSAVTGGYTLGSAQTLAGSGTVTGAMTVAGTLSPGSSPGILTTGNQTWSNGGDYNFQMLDATGVAGTGFDQIQVTGTLDLTNLTTAGFAINLWSLGSTGPDVNGDALNFNNTISQSWNILTTTGGITGFNAPNFVVNVAANNGTNGFSNALGGGSFSLGTDTNNLILNFTPIPEPRAALLGALGLLALLRRRRY